MEAKLNQRFLNRFQKTYSTVFTVESSEDAVVPDVMPDIEKILRTSGAVLLRGKTTEAGRVSLTAEISASVLYKAEGEESVSSLPVSIPLSAEAESPEIGEDSRTTVMLRLTSIEAQTRNPRKISVRAEVEARIECYTPVTITLTEDVVPGVNAALHVRKDRILFTSVTDLREKTFSVIDTLTLSPEDGTLRSLLESGFTASVDELHTHAGKIIVKGTVTTQLLCEMQPGQSPADLSFSTPFSQILDMDKAGENAESVLLLTPTAAYYEAAPGEMQDAVNMELHFVLQAVTYGTEQVEVATDAYSNQFPCEVTQKSLEQDLMAGRQTLRETARGLLEVPGTLRELVSARAVLSGIEQRENETAVRIAACVLYRDEEGSLRSVQGGVRIELETGAGESLQTELAGLRMGSLYASAAADGIELRIPVEADLLQFCSCSAGQLADVSIGEEPVRLQGPSITLVPREADMDLWALAKRCASSVALIESANPETEEEEPSVMLLIPRETIYN